MDSALSCHSATLLLGVLVHRGATAAYCSWTAMGTVRCYHHLHVHHAVVEVAWLSRAGLRPVAAMVLLLLLTVRALAL